MSDEVRTSWFELLKAFAKQELLESASTCKLKIGGHGVLNKKTKVKFSTSTHHSEVLNCVHVDIWSPTTTALLGGHRYFISFINDLSRHFWVYTMRQRFEVLNMMVK